MLIPTELAPALTAYGDAIAHEELGIPARLRDRALGEIGDHALAAIELEIGEVACTPPPFDGPPRRANGAVHCLLEVGPLGAYRRDSPLDRLRGQQKAPVLAPPGLRPRGRRQGKAEPRHRSIKVSRHHARPRRLVRESFGAR